MSATTLEIRRSSASLWGEQTGAAPAARRRQVHRHHDLHRLQGLRGRLPGVERPASRRRPQQTGTYQTLPTLARRVLEPDPLQRAETADGGLAWLMRKDQCMHCEDPGCLARLPGAGRDRAVRERHRRRQPGRSASAAATARPGCPFDVPRFHAEDREDGQVHAVRGPRRRSASSPRASRPAPPAACSSAPRTTCWRWASSASSSSRPTASPQAALYDPPGVGGTGVVTVLAHGDHPSGTGCPRDPHVPLARAHLEVACCGRSASLAIFGAVVGAFGHFMKYGRKEPASPTRDRTPRAP